MFGQLIMRPPGRCSIRISWHSARTGTCFEAWVETQWDNVWPRTDDFRFTIAEVHVLVSDDISLAVVIAPWTSTGFDPDGGSVRSSDAPHRQIGRPRHPQAG